MQVLYKTLNMQNYLIQVVTCPNKSFLCIFRKTAGEPFGIGLYLLGSIFDHSCIPNCTVVFKGRELVIMATQDIPPGKIPSVAFISYVNTMDDTNTRQRQQQANWFFKCQCQLCQDTR